MASRNQGSFLNQDREPWERGCFCETYRVNKDESYSTTLTLQGVADLYLYGYESHLADVCIDVCKSKHLVEGCTYWLQVGSELFFLMPYFTYYSKTPP